MRLLALATVLPDCGGRSAMIVPTATIGSINCWENLCFLLMEVATDFEQAHFCLSPKV